MEQQRSSTTTSVAPELLRDISESLESAALELVIAVAIMLVIFVLFVWALLRAGSLPTPLALTMALSMMALVAIAGFIATGQEVLGAIAASAVGALAGAVSAQFERGYWQSDDRDED